MDGIFEVKLDKLQPKVFVFDPTHVDHITENMAEEITDIFNQSYEQDKQAMDEGRIKGGNVLSRNEEIIDRVYDQAKVIIAEMSDNYARCMILINYQMNLEFNDGTPMMKIFLAHKKKEYRFNDSVVVSSFNTKERTEVKRYFFRKKSDKA